MIPKIIHQIWIGSRNISTSNLYFVNQWKEFIESSGGDHNLWTNEKVSESNIIPKEKQKYFSSDKYPIAMKADILRYEIIKKYGGIYVDVDMELLKPLPETIWDCHFFGGIQNNGEVAIGIIGAEPDSNIMNDVCSELEHNIEITAANNIGLCEVHRYTGPVYFSNICRRYVDKKGYLFYPPNIFYPYWFTETHRKQENFRVTCPDAYTVHHWGKDWFENDAYSK